MPSFERIGVAKKAVFALGVGGLFFLLLEAFFLIVGVQPLTAIEDPLKGFAASNPLFVEDSGDLGRFHTATGKRTLFNQQAFTNPRPPGTTRVFCLGGSTTYGRPYNDTTSFVGWLREFLGVADPDHQWDVVNAGGISYGSLRIAALAQEIVAYEPDLVVLYTGHNEFLERRTYSELLRTPEPVRNIMGWLSNFRSYSFLARLLRPQPQATSGLPTAEVDAILDQSIGPDAYHKDPEWKRDVLFQFRASLRRIVETFADHRIPVILVTPGANLSDFAPFKSEPPSSFDQVQLARLLRLVRKGKESLAEGDWDAVLSFAEQGLAEDPEYAEFHFQQGRAQLGLGKPEQAARAFRKARDFDVCPLRAIQPILDIVKEVAETDGVELVDFEQWLTDEAEFGIPGEREFVDHVHPTIDAHRALAIQLLQKMQTMGLLRSGEAWKLELPAVIRRIEQRLDPRQMALAERNLAKVLGWAGKREESDRLIRKAASGLPDDADAQSLSGDAYVREQNWQAAEVAFQAALRIDPQCTRALEGLGIVMSECGDPETAESYFRRAIDLDPKSAVAHYNLGNLLLDRGQLKQAESAYKRSLAIAPDYVNSYKNLGLVSAAQGQATAAVGYFRKAVALQPLNTGLRVDLGFMLIDAGDYGSAEEIFNQNLAAGQQSVRSTVGLALCKDHGGNSADAIRLIEELLSKDPTDQTLVEFLGRLKAQ